MTIDAVHGRAVRSVLPMEGKAINDIGAALRNKPHPDCLTPEQTNAALRRMESHGEVRVRQGRWYPVDAADWSDI